MIYFVQRGNGGPVKIGRAVDHHARIRSLQTASPEPLLVLAIAPGGAARESMIHQRLKPHRLSGEWYQPVPELHALIAEIQTPEFIVKDARAYAVLRRRAVGAPTRPCPFCGEPHIHGEGDGHRATHCGNGAEDEVRSGAVVLRREDGYLILTDGYDPGSAT